MRRSLVLLATLFSCAVLACDGGGGKSELADLGVDDGYAKGVSTSAMVDGSRDVRITLKSGALVDVPAGAVTKDVKISIERPEDAKAIKLVDNLKAPGRIVSAPYVLTPHGTTFKEDVRVTLPIAKDSSKALRVAWLADEKDTQWKLLGVPKSNGEKATIALKHFSVLLLVEGEEDLEPMEEGSDPGASDRDAGGSGPEGGLVARDGGVAELDGGGADFDAGSSGRDAMAPAPADAGVAMTIDGGQMPASPFYGRLQQCGLIERGGAFYEPPVYGPYQNCIFGCLTRGSCDDIRLAACSSEFSLNLLNCFEACVPTIVCPDQTTGLRCDGFEDCLDGSDESSCGNLYFQCSAGQSILSENRCDGYADCLNGRDEVDCPHHICTSNGASLPPDAVCDGFDDCGDGSDEPPTCAVIICSAPPVGASQATATQTVVADAGAR